MEEKAEEKLQEKENLLRAILDETADAIFIKDRQGKYLLVNKVGALNFGKTPEELIGNDNSVAALPPETLKEIEDSEMKVIKSEETLTYEVKIPVNGVIRTFQSTKSPYRDHLGRIIGVIGTSRDITRQKLTEEQLRAENAYRKPIEEAMSAGVVAMANITGKLIYTNPAFCKIVGWSDQELVGLSPPFPFWPPEDRENILKILKSRLLNDNPPEIEIAFERKNGERFPALLNTAPLTDGRGNKIGIVSTIADITRLKLSETRLRESHNLLNSIIEGTSDAIYLRNLNGDYMMINTSGAKYFGKNPQEMIGKNVSEFFSPKYLEIMATSDKRMLHSGKTFTYEHPAEINGKHYTFWTVRGPIRNHKNEITGFFGVSHDITDRKKKEEDLAKQEKLESLGILAGGIAHDFNNILTAIVGNVSLAKVKIGSQNPIFKILAEAEKASLRAKGLAGQLLTFAKGGQPIKHAASIKDLLNDSVDFVLRGSNVRAKLNIPETLWTVDIDDGQISQVIQNLVINARQAMKEGGVIDIRAENLMADETIGLSIKAGRYVKISIRDRGEGISKEDLSKIFVPYFTTKQKGTGLGLSITYSVIQKHGGLITVYSELGKGTTFYIYLPASSQDSIHENIKPEIFTGSGRVLVIDDEVSILDIAKEMLEFLGYEVRVSPSSEEAVLKFQNARDLGQKFDLVITDLTFPGEISGIELHKKLREIDPQIKVIVSSGYSNESVMADFNSFGFSGVITKPYNISELSKILKEVLKN